MIDETELRWAYKQWGKACIAGQEQSNSYNEFFDTFAAGARWAAKQNLIAKLPSEEEITDAACEEYPATLRQISFEKGAKWIRSFIEGEKNEKS